MYYTYMLRCKDNSIYTGITNDLNKRMSEHFSKDKNGAKYTKSHDALKVETAWQTKEKSMACKLEYYIKDLTKSEKETLIINKCLKEYLKGKVDCRRYKVVNFSEILDKKFWKIIE